MTPQGNFLHHRLATQADVQMLAEMNHQLIQDEGHRNPMSLIQLIGRMSSWLDHEYTAVIFERDGNSVAYALYRTDGASIYLRQFFVQRQWRRRGIGKRALHILLNEVWPQDWRITVDVLSTNASGYAFWKSVGFQDYAITLEILPEGKSG